MMEDILVLAVVGVWIICIVLTCGIITAYLQHLSSSHRMYCRDPDEDFREDFKIGLIFGVAFGPGALIYALCITGFARYGLLYRRPKLKRMSREE
ncbi:MAG: hypothetical protein KGI50_06150 [Patescibacteria group bacterium]|nr:hypothetical protein [Patescibacteria group bacterium]MDE2438982.1 hypothetical protein [Patescibacteria group bacterium]